MKKYLGMLLVVAMVLSLVACGKKPAGEEENNGGNSQTTTQQTSNSNNTSNESNTSNVESGDNQKTDEKKLDEAISYQKDGEGNIVFSIKTSAEIKRSSGWLGICPLGVYLTEEAADEVDSYYAYFDSSYEKEWFDGIYTFKLEDASIECATYTMVLCDDDDCGNVIGEWIFSKDKSGNIEISFDDAWLEGAGEGRNPEEFDSLGEEVESWFTFNEFDDEWAEFFFDGYYLEQIDPQEYDSYYLMVCPEGDYATYNEAMAAHIGDYSGIFESCPYKFSIDHSSIEPGKYTMVLARDERNDLGVGGNVEIQFGVEKVNATKWKMDFSNAKCPALESKYADASASSTASENVAESDVIVGDGEWTSTKFPKPENCTIVGATDSFDGPVIMVEWADKDAFLAYVDVLVGMGEGSVEDNLSETDGAAVYNSYNIHVAYSEMDSAQNNILIY